MTALGLDLVEAAKVAKSETYGEWYRDPWGWPELSAEFVSSLEVGQLGEVRSGPTPLRLSPAFHPFAFPKSFFGVRPAVVFDAPSRLLYTASSLRLSRDLHRELPPWVFGWRFRDGALASNEWAEYATSQEDIGRSAFAAQTDLNSFFATVDNTRLAERLVELASRSASTEIVRQVLEAHDQLAGRSGLPQRSLASSLLAHIAVEGIDDLLDTRLRDGALQSVRRWMDDISFEGTESALYSTLLELQERGRQVGLEINASKTIVSTGQEVSDRLGRERQRLIRVPRLEQTIRDDYADLFDTFIDGSDLAEAESRVLADPKNATRTEAGLVLRSLRHYGAFNRVSAWLNAARYLPHAADHLSRFAVQASQESILEPDTALWFEGLQADGWPHLPWVRAQHSLAVSSESATNNVTRTWKEWLENSDSLQQVATATQRLTRAPSADIRSAITGRIDRTTDPLVVRALALGLVDAGGDRRIVRSALERHPSNRLTLLFLDGSGWTLPSVSDDFDPSVHGE